MYARSRTAVAALACAILPLGDVASQVPEPTYLEQIEALAARDDVRLVMDRIRELDPWTLERLVELTQIPAPPFLEEARGRRFAELLRELGADSVWTDEVGNVVGLRRGRGGTHTVALGGHLDTVVPEGTDMTVRMRGDTLFAPGVGDDTRGLVETLTVLRALEDVGLETDADVLFVGTVGEEGLGDLRGMKHLFRPGADPIDAWIEIDGNGLDQVVTAGLGSLRYRVTFTGPGGHSWGTFGAANPAHALGRAIRRFQDVADTLTRAGPRTSYNVGRIGGGTSVNSIPFEAWMEVDMRSESPAALETITHAFERAVLSGLRGENALRRSGPALAVRLDTIGDRPSGQLDPAEPLVQRAMAATLHFGGDPEPTRSSTNANIPIAEGIPAVTLGRGGEGENTHAPGEWWTNRQGHLGIQRALLVLLAQAGIPAASD